MSTLDFIHTWEKWAPNIGDNRTRKGGPVLWLELATGLTSAQLLGIGAKLKGLGDVEMVGEATDVEAALDTFRAGVRSIYADALGPHVRIHGGPHTVAGQPLATLTDYITLVQQRADMGFPAMGELRAALTKFNSFEGPDELFSLRNSGGARSTDGQSNAADESPTGSP